METDLRVCITKIDESTKSAHKRIDELQDVVKAFYSLASDVKVLAEQLVNMKTDVNDIKKKVEASENEPNRMLFSFKQTAVNAIIMVIVGALMALVIK